MLPKNKENYTYDDYLKWDETERIEILDGFAYLQATPSRAHQSVSMELSRQISTFLKGKSCEVYAAPFSVKLDEKNVVEPDITIVCDKGKITEKGINGAPNLIIEIISPSSVKVDKMIKFNKYEKFGIKEYWIVDPLNKSVDVFILGDNNRYDRQSTYIDEEKIKLSIIPELEVDLKLVFE